MPATCSWVPDLLPYVVGQTQGGSSQYCSLHGQGHGWAGAGSLDEKDKEAASHVCPALFMWLTHSGFCWGLNAKCQKKTPLEGLATPWPSLLPQSCFQVILLLSIVLVGLLIYDPERKETRSLCCWLQTQERNWSYLVLVLYTQVGGICPRVLLLKQIRYVVYQISNTSYQHLNFACRSCQKNGTI